MAGGAEARARGVRLPPDRPSESPRFVRPERSMGLSRPANSTRRSTSLSSVISPRTIDPKKGGPKTLVFREGGEDLRAQLFDLVGHIFRLESLVRLFLKRWR